MRKAVELSPGTSFYLSGLGLIFARAGKAVEAERIIEDLKDLLSKQLASPYHIAFVYAGLNENDNAFEWLEKAYKDRYEMLIWLDVIPFLNSIRTDPRFPELLKKSVSIDDLSCPELFKK